MPDQDLMVHAWMDPSGGTRLAVCQVIPRPPHPSDAVDVTITEKEERFCVHVCISRGGYSTYLEMKGYDDLGDTCVDLAAVLLEHGFDHLAHGILAEDWIC